MSNEKFCANCQQDRDTKRVVYHGKLWDLCVICNMPVGKPIIIKEK